jgi:hypothetical protein
MAKKKQYKPIVDRILFCRSCSKPIVGEYYTVPAKNNIKATKFIYHMTPMDCANAEELRKDWYRQYGANGNIKSRA